ncbi:hypothetical protein [Salininema proteolyticum]|uniref:DUF5668 domain-containing protein n=1 Tax=Salininema proteolyticum TaxID=1607685 RepID=A0ABV8TVV7_9ACTN
MASTSHHTRPIGTFTILVALVLIGIHALSGGYRVWPIALAVILALIGSALRIEAAIRESGYRSRG